VTKDKNHHGVRGSTEELRKAQRRFCEDLLQILRRLDEMEKQISRLEQEQEIAPRTHKASGDNRRASLTRWDSSTHP
jgi:hypothetical protein